MDIKTLRIRVCEANRRLSSCGLAPLTWGNVSGIDRESGTVIIKPSGVPYEDLTPENLSAVDVLSGKPVSDGLKPSSDLPAHLEIYRAWPDVAGVVHTHSPFAVSFAQAYMPITCMGTTHADTFYGEIPCVRFPDETETGTAYEASAGRIIVNYFKERRIDPMSCPAALASGHGPFVWGHDPESAVDNAYTLEQVSLMALCTLSLNPSVRPLPSYIADRHYFRKHGKNAYYGQR